MDWEDPLLYHLILNAGALTEEAAARLVLQAAPLEMDAGGQFCPRGEGAPLCWRGDATGAGERDDMHNG